MVFLIHTVDMFYYLTYAIFVKVNVVDIFALKSLHSATLFTSLEFLFEVSDKKTNTAQNESVGLCHVGYSQIGTYATFPHT